MNSPRVGWSLPVVIAAVGLVLSACVVYEPAPYPRYAPAPRYYSPGPSFGFEFGDDWHGEHRRGWGHRD
jgi:hypothetical protein